MKTICALLLVLALAACATQLQLDEARRQFADGRGEEALALLERLARENPTERAVRREYLRTRELLVAQWLAQAEVLRGSGQSELAEALYQRVQRHDSGNVRAAAGLVQLETERRQQAVVNAAEELARSGRYAEAQDRAGTDVARSVVLAIPIRRSSCASTRSWW